MIVLAVMGVVTAVLVITYFWLKRRPREILPTVPLSEGDVDDLLSQESDAVLRRLTGKTSAADYRRQMRALADAALNWPSPNAGRLHTD